MKQFYWSAVCLVCLFSFQKRVIAQDALLSLAVLDSLPATHHFKAKQTELTSIVKLDVSFQRLRKVPAKILQCVNLQYLALHYNQIQELPLEFIRLQQLQVLYIGYGVNYEKVIPILANLPHLKKVVFHDDLPNEASQERIRQRLPGVAIYFYDV